MKPFTLVFVAALVLLHPCPVHAKSMLTDDEVLLIEDMQLAGFTMDQIDQVISIRVNTRETGKKWTEAELRQLDARLRAHWRSMIKALAGGDIDKAVSYFDRNMRDVHHMLLAAIDAQQRGRLLEALEDIIMIGVKGPAHAEYR
jgi:hypothetical protein